MRPIILRPVPPFDFSRTAAIFSRGDPGIRVYRDGIFRQALDIDGIPLLVEVRSGGTTGLPELSIAIKADHRVTARIKKRAGELISRIFSTGDDLSPFYRAMETDPVMAGLVRQLCGLRAPSTPSVFEALVDSVIEQQISLHVAQGIEHRLIRALGNTISTDGTTFYCYPTAPALAETTDAMFRAFGLTLRKGEYIRGISRQILAGDIDPEAFRDEPDTEAVIHEMMKIRGIGRWTAELSILRGLHRPDAFPADDVGVRRFISKYYRGGKKITAAEARDFAERWGAWKGFAAYYLEVADLLVPGKQKTASTRP
jgi:DNA-3-methyladenine glycosylase II